MHCEPLRYCKQGPRNVTSFLQIPAEKIPPTVENVKESSVICPGGQYRCPLGYYTCCKLPSKGYSCCPFVRANCCIDGLHCCPEHMHCENPRHCNRGPRNFTSLLQIPAAPTVANVN
ncbi:hypothetical protein AVEN_162845-1 [Araneus ventricosus]|uniref:Granulins domain-containing protein n=1 Tax=Araneus ventricosus TaxID=182803 RepID=A0A4Y2C939_ARAVE|nr:hypothetical protein AVEN_162845-1 [Araneus ventricosus]